jgi:hypothetical protein
MEDLSFFAILRELASAHFPSFGWRAMLDSSLTEVGSRVLELQEDHVHLSGVERWLGGVHLTGSDAVWRWDKARNRFA